MIFRPDSLNSQLMASTSSFSKNHNVCFSGYKIDGPETSSKIHENKKQKGTATILEKGLLKTKDFKISGVIEVAGSIYAYGSAGGMFNGRGNSIVAKISDGHGHQLFTCEEQLHEIKASASLLGVVGQSVCVVYDLGLRKADGYHKVNRDCWLGLEGVDFIWKGDRILFSSTKQKFYWATHPDFVVVFGSNEIKNSLRQEAIIRIKYKGNLMLKNSGICRIISTFSLNEDALLLLLSIKSSNEKQLVIRQLNLSDMETNIRLCGRMVG